MYIYIPKAKRVQARKSAPRAWKGIFVSYEGDNGHVFKVWNPVTRKLTTSRDVNFPQPGDDYKDDNLGAGSATQPKPSGPSGDGEDVELPAILVEREREPLREVVIVHQQTPVTPSTIHLTIHGSVSTVPETPRITRQRLLPAPAPIRQGNLFTTARSRTPAPRISEVIEENTVPSRLRTIEAEATQRDDQTTQEINRADFEKRLRELSVQIDDMQTSMLDVHERARLIGQNIARETANTREETLSPEDVKGNGQRVIGQFHLSIDL